MCDQCDHKATWKGYLKQLVKSIPKGVRYSCIQCDHEAKSIHMGANFACSHCDYKATQKENLKVLVGTFMNYFVTHEDNLIIKQLKPY